MKSYFVNSGDIRIHVLENGTASETIPSLLVIGGLWEPAERAIPILSGLSSHVVALSLRGRGLSSTPSTGYDLEDHLSDIDAVVNHCRLQNYCVLGFSRGVSYALGWSFKNQKNMKGLILVDQPPIHLRPGPGYVEFWSSLVYLGVPILNFMRHSALERLAEEASDIDFSDRLSELNIPVSVFAGKNKDSAITSGLTEDIIQTYIREIPACEVISFEKSGHMIPDDEEKKYIEEIASFIGKI